MMGIVSDTVGDAGFQARVNEILQEKYGWSDERIAARTPAPAPILPSPPAWVDPGMTAGAVPPPPGSGGVAARPTPGAAVDMSGINRDRFWPADAANPYDNNWWKGPTPEHYYPTDDPDNTREIPVDWKKEGLTPPSENHQLHLDSRTQRMVWYAPGGVGGTYELSAKDAEKADKWIDRDALKNTRLVGSSFIPGGTFGAMMLAPLIAGQLGLLPNPGAAGAAAGGFSPYPGIGGEALGTGGLPPGSFFADGVIGPDAFSSVQAAQAAGYGPGLTEYVVSAQDLARAGVPGQGGGAGGGTRVLDLLKQYGPSVLGVLGAVGGLGGGREEGGGRVPTDAGGMPGPPPPTGGAYTPGGLLPRRVARAQPAGLAPAQGYFPSLVTVPQPTEAEIEIQEAQLELMRQGLQHGEDSHAAILQGFGFAQDPESGEIRQLTEDEYLGTLTESQRGIYELQLLDIERQRRALNRETPVSEGLQMQRDREYEQLREALARQGHALTGDAPATAVATSTAGAQRLGRFNERFALAEEAEREGQIARGTQAILGREGLFGNLRGERAARAANLIGYGSEFFNRAGQAGGLLQPYQYQRGLEANTALANQAAANEAARFRAAGQNQFSLARAGFGQAANLYNAQASNQADADRANQYNLFRYGAFQNQQNQAFQQQQAREARRAQDRSALWQGVGNLAGNLLFGGGGGNNQRQQGLFSFF